MADTTTHLALPKPNRARVPSRNIDEEFDALALAWDTVDAFLYALAQLVAQKAPAEHDHAMSAITGLIDALNAKMSSDRQFALDDLTDVEGAAGAPTNYVLVKSSGGLYVPSSALAALGVHPHLIAEVTGLAAALTDRPTRAEVAEGLEVLNDDLMAEIQKRGVPVGTMVHSAVPLESQGYLLANGAPCTPVTPDLRAALLAGGSPFGHNGTDPLLPDEVSANRFRRAAGGGLPLGTVQDDQMQGHEHNQHVSATSGTTAGLYTRGVGTDDDRAGSTETSGPISDGLNGTPRVGAETRPKGIAYLPYIKAFGAITIEGMADLSALFNALATEMEAIAGADNTKLMTALRTKQSVAKFAGIVTRLPEVATTSGTAFDFAIDPTATEIMVDLGQVQLSGTDTMIVQLGTSGGFVVTGYDGGTFLQVSGSSAALAPTSGFGVSGNTAARYANGTLILRRIGTSTRWVAHYASGTNGNLAIYAGGGSVDLGAAVTQLRLTRTGSNTFAAGRVGVEYRKNA